VQFTETFLARQPIFDTSGAVWGYEILHRNNLEAVRSALSDPFASSLEVAAGICLCRPQDLKAGRKVLVPFDEHSILDGIPYALPAASTVIQVMEAQDPGARLIEALRELRGEGYTVAVNGFESLPRAEPLLDLAEIAIIDVPGKNSRVLAALATSARRRCRILLARRVENSAARDAAAILGFTHFQGSFFQRPSLVSGRTFKAHQVARLALLRLTGDDDPDFGTLAEAIKSDVAISYRLLVYLNSPLFTFHISIRSIEQAIVLLGWKQVRNWLRVVILSEIVPEARASELSFLSVQRGRFFEMAARQAGMSADEREEVFMLGLFSLLDALLQMPMAEVLESLPLEEGLKTSLLGRPGRLSPWLAMAREIEAGKWEEAEGQAVAFGLAPSLVARAYAESLDWANRFFAQGAPGEDEDFVPASVDLEEDGEAASHDQDKEAG
jgi:EAL and modified HD-GYP domain-containing signal transduction protein